MTGGDTITSRGSPLKFTITCISSGGPATNVTWTRYSVVITEGTESILVHPKNATYHHTLTDSYGGEYECYVSNKLSLPASSGRRIIGGKILSF